MDLKRKAVDDDGTSSKVTEGGDVGTTGASPTKKKHATSSSNTMRPKKILLAFGE